FDKIAHPPAELPALYAEIPSAVLPTEAVVTRRRRRRTFRRSRWVPTLVLFSVDVLAFVAAVFITHTVQWKTLVVLALVVAFFSQADLYRSRLSMSILDDGPAIVGRALAAGAAAMVLGGLNDGLAGTARLGTAVVFAVLCLPLRTVA